MSAQQATLAPYPLLPNAMVRECTSNTRRFWLRGRTLTEAFLNGLLAMASGASNTKSSSEANLRGIDGSEGPKEARKKDGKETRLLLRS